MTRWRPGAGALLVIAGVALVVVGVQDRPARLEPGRNSFVNADRPGIDAHNSPAAAAHPDRPEVLAVADRIDTPRFSCSVALSNNGGITWQTVALPLPPAAPNCHGPDVGFDGAGDLLVLYTATGGRFNQPVGVWLQRVRDGVAEGDAVAVAGPEAFHAHMAVTGAGVLVTWIQAQPAAGDQPLGFPPPPNPVVVARSGDGGRTFSDPVQVSEDPLLVVQPSLMAGPDGRVVVGALDLGEDRLDYLAGHQGQGGAPSDAPWRVVSWASDDGGVGFGPVAEVAAGLVPPRRIIVNLAPAPSFARDPRSGRLYAAWDAGQGDGHDVFLATSDDGGTTWSPATPVVRRPGGQSLPAVAVSPTGRVDVVFYDRSADPDDVMTEVTLASSEDGGRSFTVATISDAAFDSRIGFGSAQGLPQLGSQLALLSQPGRALAFWADTRNGTQATNVQDLAVAVVEIVPTGERRWPVVVMGAVLAVAGTAMLLASLRARRRTTWARSGL